MSVAEKAQDPAAVCGNIWSNGTAAQRAGFAGGAAGRGSDEKPPKAWWDDCMAHVGKSATASLSASAEQGWVKVRDWDNDRLIRGYITQEKVDVQGDIIPVAEVVKNLAEHGPSIIINYEHSMTDKGTVPLGQIVKWRQDTDKVEIVAGLYKGTALQDGIWEDIKRTGTMAGFSVGGAVNKKVCNGHVCKLTGVDIVEISYTKSPANQGAVITAVNKMAKGAALAESMRLLRKATDALAAVVDEDEANMDPKSEVILAPNPPMPAATATVVNAPKAGPSGADEPAHKCACGGASQSNPSPGRQIGRAEPAAKAKGDGQDTDDTKEESPVEPTNTPAKKQDEAPPGSAAGAQGGDAELLDMLKQLIAAFEARAGAAAAPPAAPQETAPKNAEQRMAYSSPEEFAKTVGAAVDAYLASKGLGKAGTPAVGTVEDNIGAAGSGEGEGVKPKDKTEAYSASVAELQQAIEKAVAERLGKSRLSATVDARTKAPAASSTKPRSVVGIIEGLKKSDPSGYAIAAGGPIGRALTED